MKSILRILLFSILLMGTHRANSQNSVAHTWIEVNLESVRLDFAKPVVHARNLWHTSVAMYDAWAAYDSIADPYFLGKSLGNFQCPYVGVPEPADAQVAQEQALSYAAYRMLRHRYANAPNNATIFNMLDTTMAGLGYNPNYINTDYVNGGPGALGNYIAEQLISAGLGDGANELNGYDNQFYEPVNEELVIDEAHFIGNPDIDSLNRWQPLGLTLFCDQAGNSFTLTPEFLGAEWGAVLPFALSDSVKTIKSRDGIDWNLYHDPGAPPRIGLEGDQQTSEYRWGMDLVAKWSSYLDPADPTTVDISPASLGNIPLSSMPDDFADYPLFYNRDSGGDIGTGYAENPATSEPYTPQIVKRGDYARILAEFWADGPDSETPPGHWFAIYNEISQYPDFTWQWNATGDPLSRLEYDIKTYFTLGGAMHDAAITAWSVKGYYDYIRPVSAIRAMAELGQSSDPLQPNFHPAGLELEPGHIEYVQLGDTIYEGDTLLVAEAEHVDMLKLKCWIGPLAEDTCISGFAPEYQSDVAGVGWKFALDFWPYQRPTFVTPPFAGYVSGHSTFSRAAAEVMTLTTGDAYFPGGMGEFFCPQDGYLVFEDGPSTDITLQWATYQDASDQCSLSRIYGGIHPPADDLPGRKMGYKVGHHAYALAERYFNGGVPEVESISYSDQLITDVDDGEELLVTIEYGQRMDTSVMPQLASDEGELTFTPSSSVWTSDSTHVTTLIVNDGEEYAPEVILSIGGGKSLYGVDQEETFESSEVLFIDMLNPSGMLVVNDNNPMVVTMDISFSETMDTNTAPMISFPNEDPLASDVALNGAMSSWIDPTMYHAHFDVLNGAYLADIDVLVSMALDSVGNLMSSIEAADQFSVDLRAPLASSVVANDNVYANADVGTGALSISITYDEVMDMSSTPSIAFTADNPLSNSLTLDAAASMWTDNMTYTAVYDLTDADEELNLINLQITGAIDAGGLMQEVTNITELFTIDTQEPEASLLSATSSLLLDAQDGIDWYISFLFTEEMDESVTPTFTFPAEDPSATLTLVDGTWTTPDNYQLHFTVSDANEEILDIDFSISDC